MASAFRIFVAFSLLAVWGASAQENFGETPKRSAPSAGGRPSEISETPTSKTSPRGRMLEEIVVTAQRKEQAVTDVPISLSVLDQEFLAEKGIFDIAQISTFVPNMNVRLNPVLPDIRLRGFATGTINKAFEQSVGLNVDGIPYARLPYYGAGFMDLERVEVLRGPQGTLFGKNSSAGLLNMIPNDPTPHYTGFVDARYGNFDYHYLEGAAGGPIIDDVLQIRVTALSTERRGFMTNTTARTPVGRENNALRFPRGSQRNAARVRMLFPDLLGSRLRLSYEHFQIRAFGAGQEITVIPESTKPFYREWDPNADFEKGNYVNSYEFGDGSRSEANTVVGLWDTEVDGWGLDVVGGWTFVDIFARLDLDSSPFPGFQVTSVDENPQWTGEARITSPALEGFFGLPSFLGLDLGETDFLAGFFYQRRQMLDSAITLEIDVPVLAEFIARQEIPSPLPPIVPLPDQVYSESSTVHFNQTGQAFALFGQSDWRFLEDWALITGLRVQHETKEADWNRVFNSPTSLTFTEVLEWEAFQATRKRTELSVVPKIALNWKPFDDLSLFARWSKGFKGGGLNEAATRDDTFEDLQYKPERVTEYALDVRWELFGGAARWNATAFWMDVEDFQVLTSPPGNVVVIVINAGKARSRGLETDLTWLPTEWLSLFATLGINDGKYLEFVDGYCPQDMENHDGDENERCDLSGARLERAPLVMATLTPSLTLPFSIVPFFGDLLPRGGGFFLSLTGEYQTWQDLAGHDDPRKFQGDFFRLGGLVGFGDTSEGWSFGVLATNLTNIDTAQGASEVQTGAGHIVQHPNPPRQWNLQFRYSF